MGSSVSIQVSPAALIFLAALILILPLQWVGAVVLAALVHECAHALAVWLTGGKVLSVRIGGRGAVMETAPMTGIQETVCAFAGPAGSLLLLLCARWMPRTAVCGAIHGIYNLIPLFPLDGGRVLRGLFYGMLSPELAQKLFSRSQTVVATAILLGCLLLARTLGILPILFGFVLLRMYLRENPLAIGGFWRYNRRNTDKEVVYDRTAETNSPHGAKTGPVHRRGIQRN